MASVIAINRSVKKGVPKETILEGHFIVDFGLEGDAHAGKWHRQVSLLGLESIKKIAEMGIEGLCTGRFAENLTTEGIVLYELPVGTQFYAGPVLFEVTQIAKNATRTAPFTIKSATASCRAKVSSPASSKAVPSGLATRSS